MPELLSCVDAEDPDGARARDGANGHHPYLAAGPQRPSATGKIRFRNKEKLASKLD